MSRIIAVIGTAGRNRSPLLTKAMWEAMYRDLAKRISFDDTLVSGGAAWADHLAVAALMRGNCARLNLHLPAPLYTVNGFTRFIGPRGSSGSAANYYHGLFAEITGVPSLWQLGTIAQGWPQVAMSYEEPATGYGGMAKRNVKVAAGCTEMIAYTFGEDEPDDGGTGHTWDLAIVHGVRRTHVSMQHLLEAESL